MEYLNYLALGYFGLLSLIGFVIMGIDKQRARAKAWRIPEKTLLIIAFLGGGPGSMLGMYIFRHKTKHAKFIILIPLATLLSLFAIYQVITL